MTQNITEARISKRIGLGASYGVLAIASAGYGLWASQTGDTLADQIAAGGMMALPGIIAMGALASAMTARNRQLAIAVSVGAGALVLQGFNSFGYWQAHDANVVQAKAQLSEARKVEARFAPTPSQPIKTRISMLVEEGGPKERRWIRQERRRLAGELAEAQQSEAMHSGLKARVTEAEGALKSATAASIVTTAVKTVVFTFIEAAGPAAMALSAIGKEAPAKPAQAPQPSPASLLARRRWDAQKLAKADPLNGIPA